MPFGLTSASEVFQYKNELTFKGIEGVHSMADNITIAVDEDDTILRKVLERAREHNIKLDCDKLQLRVNIMKYLGTITSSDGIKPDPDKVSAISNMSVPIAVCRLLGMVNYLANHIPNMFTIMAPLHDLVKENTHFQWGPEHHIVVEKLKVILSDAPVLQYLIQRYSVIQADASQHGLGAYLLQKGCPVAYASRNLNPAESNYTQIEKELLAIVFACNKFHHYIYGFLIDVHSVRYLLDFTAYASEVSKVHQYQIHKGQRYAHCGCSIEGSPRCY